VTVVTTICYKLLRLAREFLSVTSSVTSSLGLNLGSSPPIFIGDSSPCAFLRHVGCKGSAREHRDEEVKIRPRTGAKS
jgi:hypothetical protein